MVIISNLAFVKNKMIPKLIEVFEAKFKLAVRATDGAVKTKREERGYSTNSPSFPYFFSRAYWRP